MFKIICVGVVQDYGTEKISEKKWNTLLSNVLMALRKTFFTLRGEI